MRTFSDNFESESIELKNVKGESTIIKTNFLPADKIQDIYNRMLSITKNKSLDIYEEIFKTMVECYGQTVEFWRQFSPGLLKDLIHYFLESQQKKN